MYTDIVTRLIPDKPRKPFILKDGSKMWEVGVSNLLAIFTISYILHSVSRPEIEYLRLSGVRSISSPRRSGRLARNTLCPSILPDWLPTNRNDGTTRRLYETTLQDDVDAFTICKLTVRTVKSIKATSPNIFVRDTRGSHATGILDAHIADGNHFYRLKIWDCLSGAHRSFAHSRYHLAEREPICSDDIVVRVIFPKAPTPANAPRSAFNDFQTSHEYSVKWYK